MWGLLHYFNFQGNPANLAPIHTCCAWSDVHKHLPHISKRLGCLFMGLSPQACLKDLGGCRSLWYDRQVRFVMLKYGTVPEEGVVCARGDGTRCCGCSRAHGWARGELWAYTIYLHVLYPCQPSVQKSDQWLQNYMGKPVPPVLCLWERGLKSIIKDTLYDVGRLVSMALTDGLRGPFKVMP